MRGGWKQSRRWFMAALALVVLAAGGGTWWWVTSPDGFDKTEQKITVNGDEPTKVDSTLYAPDASPAPAVLLAHGFGGTKDSMDEQATELAEQGYVVLTYTARGFGESGGQIHLNSPDHEVSDASQLLDYLAQRPEVENDASGDPRVGAVGGSYGGALSLLLAGYDDRVDAVVPQVTWNSLADALFPNFATDDDSAGVFKSAWAGLFYGTGLAAPTSGDVDPACGRWAPEPCQMYQRVAASGELDEESRQLLDESSPQSILDEITAPTLLLQGQADSLFGLDQSDANAAGITNAPVKVSWFSGGHDATGTEADRERSDALTAGWLDHYLKGQGAPPGDAFDFTRIGGADSSRADLATLGMRAGDYPGLDGGAQQPQALQSPGPQAIASPANGVPAAISTVPSLGGLGTLGGGRGARDIPGQFAMADTDEADEVFDIVGSPRITLRAASETGEAVLFLKMYDVDPQGQQTLPNGLVAPVRLTDLPADIADAEPVTVELPGIVHRVEPGHTMRVVASTSDDSYTGPAQAANYTVAFDDEVALPQVSATPQSNTDTAWLAALIAIAGGIPLTIAAAWAIGRWRYRRRDRAFDPEHADTPLLVRDLRKTYAGGLVAVDGVDLTVQRGQVMGLLGPNGAGKTTTLRVLMGMLRPTGGTMRVFGHEITPGAPVLSRLGALVEGPGLLPHLSGMDNLRLFWRTTGRPETQAHLDEVIAIAGLGDAINRKVRTYSHGMKQRVAIAQAMLGMPELLVLDEPTDGLDPPQIAEMRRVLHDYASQGRAVLVSSHLLAEVEQTCTHVVVMSGGKVVASGQVHDVIGAGGRLEDAFLELVER